MKRVEFCPGAESKVAIAPKMEGSILDGPRTQYGESHGPWLLGFRSTPPMSSGFPNRIKQLTTVFEFSKSATISETSLSRPRH